MTNAQKHFFMRSPFIFSCASQLYYIMNLVAVKRERGGRHESGTVYRKKYFYKNTAFGAIRTPQIELRAVFHQFLSRAHFQ